MVFLGHVKKTMPPTQHQPIQSQSKQKRPPVEPSQGPPPLSGRSNIFESSSFKEYKTLLQKVSRKIDKWHTDNL